MSEAMELPKGESALVAADYHFEGRGKCYRCGQELEWWDTPDNKIIPLDPGTLESHRVTCPRRGSHHG